MDGFDPSSEIKYIPIAHWKEIEEEPKIYRELLEEAHKQYRIQLRELNVTNNKLGEASQSWSKMNKKIKRAKRYQEDLQEDIVESKNVIEGVDAEIQYYLNQIAMEEKTLQLEEASLSECTNKLHAQQRKTKTIGSIAVSVAEERLKQKINSIQELDLQLAEEEPKETISSAAESPHQDAFSQENVVKDVVAYEKYGIETFSQRFSQFGISDKTETDGAEDSKLVASTDVYLQEVRAVEVVFNFGGSIGTGIFRFFQSLVNGIAPSIDGFSSGSYGGGDNQVYSRMQVSPWSSDSFQRKAKNGGNQASVHALVEYEPNRLDMFLIRVLCQLLIYAERERDRSNTVSTTDHSRVIAELESQTKKSNNKSRRDEATMFAKSLLEEIFESVVGGASKNEEGVENARDKRSSDCNVKTVNGDDKVLSSGSVPGVKGTTKAMKEVTGNEDALSNDRSSRKNVQDKNFWDKKSREVTTDISIKINKKKTGRRVRFLPCQEAASDKYDKNCIETVEASVQTNLSFGDTDRTRSQFKNFLAKGSRLIPLVRKNQLKKEKKIDQLNNMLRANRMNHVEVNEMLKEIDASYVRKDGCFGGIFKQKSKKRKMIKLLMEKLENKKEECGEEEGQCQCCSSE